MGHAYVAHARRGKFSAEPLVSSAPMAACPYCRNPSWMSGVPCSKCGRTSQAAPDIELELPAPPPPKPKLVTSKRNDEELKIDLAVDPEDLRAPAPIASSGGSFPPPRTSSAPIALAQSPARTVAMSGAPLANRTSTIPTPLENDDELAARTLANYGVPPAGALFAPLYAYKVYKRRKELALALRGRREELELAARKLDDGLVALGERARATAAGDENAKKTLESLAAAEKLLRSRDQSLAREHDQHKERIASLDQRLAGVESELGQAQSSERGVAAELADAQTQLQRAEARLKQAENEIKAITSRERGAKG
jgi:hypothetical protein